MAYVIWRIEKKTDNIFIEGITENEDEAKAVFHEAYTQHFEENALIIRENDIRVNIFIKENGYLTSTKTLTHIYGISIFEG